MKWYLVQPDSDGAGFWVTCRLCGDKVTPKRFFSGTVAEALAHQSGREHLDSIEHRAALAAYRDPDLDPSVELLRKIFGNTTDPDEAERNRRRAARSAAAVAVARRAEGRPIG